MKDNKEKHICQEKEKVKSKSCDNCSHNVVCTLFEPVIEHFEGIMPAITGYQLSRNKIKVRQFIGSNCAFYQKESL